MSAEFVTLVRRPGPTLRRWGHRAPLPFGSGTVDHILCAHHLQHLPPLAVNQELADYLRALRPGGTLHVILPDLRQSVDRYVRGEIDADELVAWQRLRGHGDDRLPARILDVVRGDRHHRWVYDAHTARRRLVGAGFDVADVPTPSTHLRLDDPHSLHLVGMRG